MKALVPSVFEPTPSAAPAPASTVIIKDDDDSDGKKAVAKPDKPKKKRKAPDAETASKPVTVAFPEAPVKAKEPAPERPSSGAGPEAEKIVCSVVLVCDLRSVQFGWAAGTS